MSISVNTFTAIVRQTQLAFGLTSLLPINSIPLFFQLGSLLFMPLIIYSLSNYKTSAILQTGSLVALLGSGLRLLAFNRGNPDFWYVQLGTVFIAFTVPYYHTAMQIVINKWFPENERSVAQAILSLTIILGAALSVSLSGVIFRYPLEIDDPKGDAQSRIRQILWIQLYLQGFSSLIFLLIYREKPAIFPSAAAKIPFQNPKISEAFSECKHNSSYLLILISFSTMFALKVSTGSLIGALLQPFGFESFQTAMILNSIVFGGLLGMVISGIILDKLQVFKFVVCAQALGSVICFGLFYWLLDQHLISTWTFCISGGILGSLITSHMPSALSFSVELTFPL